MNQPPFLLYIVDDDEDDLLFIHNAFKGIGLESVCKGFCNGHELLEHLRFAKAEELPDVIILDFEMPRMNGKEILKKLYAGFPELNSIPVIFYSDRINERLEQELKELGAFSCIRKGVTAGEQLKFAKEVMALLKK